VQQLVVGDAAGERVEIAHVAAVALANHDVGDGKSLTFWESWLRGRPS